MFEHASRYLLSNIRIHLTQGQSDIARLFVFAGGISAVALDMPFATRVIAASRHVKEPNIEGFGIVKAILVHGTFGPPRRLRTSHS